MPSDSLRVVAEPTAIVTPTPQATQVDRFVIAFVTPEQASNASPDELLKAYLRIPASQAATSQPTLQAIDVSLALGFTPQSLAEGKRPQRGRQRAPGLRRTGQTTRVDVTALVRSWQSSWASKPLGFVVSTSHGTLTAPKPGTGVQLELYLASKSEDRRR